jgi:YHS domain-containing protein
MTRRLALAFPYLCAALIILLIVVSHYRSSFTDGDEEIDYALMPTESTGASIDPVCKMEVGDEIGTTLKGKPWFFCAEMCRDAFIENPDRFLTKTCLVCRSEDVFTPIEGAASHEATWQGKTYAFCTDAHKADFRADPAGYFMHTMWGIPNWLYYSSIAFVLLISFGLFEWLAALQEQRKDEVHAPARIDLLRFKPLRKIVLHPATRFLARAFFVTIFVIVIAAGLFGNQLPSKNIAPILTWTVWWGGLVWLILYFGKAWCYVCPWQAIASWAEGLRLWGVKKEGMSLNMRWPKFMRNIWPATILFIGLTWIELGFGVTMNPRATAWLGLAMVILAFVCAFIFERESFCRYGCLVGRISGLYALFSPIEVRATSADTCAACETSSCFHGNDQGEACPTFQYLPDMQQNTYCISCMECVKSCDHGNVTLRLRPWAEDLNTGFRPRSDEAYLALLMLSLAAFHGLSMTAAWRDILAWITQVTGTGHIISFSLGMGVLMVAPGILYAILVALSRVMAGDAPVTYRDYFIRYAYALLPIALFYHLAHNSEHLLMEGQKVIALMSDPFGWEWNLFGTAHWTLAPFINLPTLWIVQVLFVMIGHVYSLWVARNVAGHLFGDSKAAMRSQVPMLLAMVLFSLMSLWLLKQPMEMHTSAM